MDVIIGGDDIAAENTVAQNMSAFTVTEEILDYR